MDASKTPGYGDFQKNFVQVVRATEFSLGVSVSGLGAAPAPANGNFTTMLPNVDESIFNDEVRSVLKDTAPILLQLGVGGVSQQKQPLVTNFMDINWQFNNPANPKDAQNAWPGPASFNKRRLAPESLMQSVPITGEPPAIVLHTAYPRTLPHSSQEVDWWKSYPVLPYYPSGPGTATHILDLNRGKNDVALGNSPLWFGEWALKTQFGPTDQFMRQWADAQKLVYSKGAGWIYWNFKVEKSSLAGDLSRGWSYLDGLERGYFTNLDPSQYHDPNVCAPYT
ncbi:hypothetical protein DFH06DRAFT_1367861 [Mycena polygramma]|nr:hypothetical protein DFH06DRAFT_1367861 [Mycena polygramma]